MFEYRRRQGRASPAARLLVFGAPDMAHRLARDPVTRAAIVEQAATPAGPVHLPLGIDVGGDGTGARIDQVPCTGLEAVQVGQSDVATHADTIRRQVERTGNECFDAGAQRRIFRIGGEAGDHAPRPRHATRAQVARELSQHRPDLFAADLGAHHERGEPAHAALRQDVAGSVRQGPTGAGAARIQTQAGARRACSSSVVKCGGPKLHHRVSVTFDRPLGRSGLRPANTAAASIAR